MSLIICYIGSKGSVIIGDKRRIGFFGNQENRELLEDELYNGTIKTEKSLLKRAEELGITLKITDDTKKVRAIDEVVVGEVKTTTPFETKRKRIYGTTGSYNMVELSGSTIKKMESGNTSIVIFGNKFTKELANKSIKKSWKKKISLQDVGEIFKKALKEVAQNTPSVSQDYDFIIKHPPLNKNQARELLRNTIIQDVKDLEKWRGELRDQMVKAARGIEMSNKILEDGLVGKVHQLTDNKVEIELADSVEARDLEWNLVAGPGETVTMEVEDPKMISSGDMAVVNDEYLCVMPSKTGLICDVVLCKVDK